MKKIQIKNRKKFVTMLIAGIMAAILLTVSVAYAITYQSNGYSDVSNFSEINYVNYDSGDGSILLSEKNYGYKWNSNCEIEYLQKPLATGWAPLSNIIPKKAQTYKSEKWESPSKDTLALKGLQLEICSPSDSTGVTGVLYKNAITYLGQKVDVVVSFTSWAYQQSKDDKYIPATIFVSDTSRPGAFHFTNSVESMTYTMSFYKGGTYDSSTFKGTPTTVKGMMSIYDVDSAESSGFLKSDCEKIYVNSKTNLKAKDVTYGGKDYLIFTDKYQDAQSMETSKRAALNEYSALFSGGSLHLFFSRCDDTATDAANAGYEWRNGFEGSSMVQYVKSQFEEDYITDTAYGTDVYNQSCFVEFQQPSTYSVKIPKILILDGEHRDENYCNYAVEIAGDIAEDQEVTVDPGNSFIMSTVSGTNKSIVANVTQKKKSAGYNDGIESNANIQNNTLMYWDDNSPVWDTRTRTGWDTTISAYGEHPLYNDLTIDTSTKDTNTNLLLMTSDNAQENTALGQQVVNTNNADSGFNAEFKYGRFIGTVTSTKAYTPNLALRLSNQLTFSVDAPYTYLSYGIGSLVKNMQAPYINSKTKKAKICMGYSLLPYEYRTIEFGYGSFESDVLLNGNKVTFEKDGNCYVTMNDVKCKVWFKDFNNKKQIPTDIENFYYYLLTSKAIYIGNDNAALCTYFDTNKTTYVMFGKISTTELSSGNWSGNFNFNISLSEKLGKSTVSESTIIQDALESESSSVAGTTAEDEKISNASYSVKVPKYLYGANTTEIPYTVSTKGNIDNTWGIYIQPKDAILDTEDIDFYIKQGTRKRIAKIEQDKMCFMLKDGVNEDTWTTANGKISTEDISAGSWKGSFLFDIYLTNYINFMSKDMFTWDGSTITGLTKLGIEYLNDNDGLLIIPTYASAIADNAFSATSIQNSINTYYAEEITKNSDDITDNDVVVPVGNTLIKKVKMFKQGITSLGNSAFSGNIALASCDLSKTITSIGNSCFNGCSSLTQMNNNINGTISIPTECTNVGTSAFVGTKFATLDLTSVENDLELGASSFQNISTLTEVSTQNDINIKLNDSCFSGCSSLSKFDLSQISYFGNAAIANCSKLAGTPNLTDKCTYIGRQCFYNTGYSTINIPKNVTNVGAEFINAATALRDVYIESKDTVFADTAFARANSNGKVTVHIADDIVVLRNGFFRGAANSNLEIIVPKATTTIDSYAISWNYNTEPIFLSKNVDTINRSAFFASSDLICFYEGDETNLKVADVTDSTFIYNSANPYKEIGTDNTANDNGFIFKYNDADKTASIWNYDGGEHTIVIPKTVVANGNTYAVTSIASGAFYGVTSLEKIVVPYTIETKQYAFFNCSAQILYTSIDQFGDEAIVGFNAVEGLETYFDGRKNNGIDFKEGLSTWSDLTENHNDATIGSSNTWASNNSLYFDGKTNTAFKNLSGNSDKTIIVTCKFDKGFVPNNNERWYGQTRVIGQDLDGTQRDWGVTITPNGNFAVGYGYTAYFDTGVKATDGNKHTVFVSYFNGIYKIIVDNKEMKTFTYVSSGTNISIWYLGAAMKGYIYDVKLYTKEFTDEEIIRKIQFVDDDDLNNIIYVSPTTRKYESSIKENIDEIKTILNSDNFSNYKRILATDGDVNLLDDSNIVVKYTEPYLAENNCVNEFLSTNKNITIKYKDRTYKIDNGKITSLVINKDYNASDNNYYAAQFDNAIDDFEITLKNGRIYKAENGDILFEITSGIDNTKKDCTISKADSLICTIGSRKYYKSYDGLALVGCGNFDGDASSMLVSDDQNSAIYKTNSGWADQPIKTLLDYKGKTWYVSARYYGFGGNPAITSNYVNLGSCSVEDGAKKLIDMAYTEKIPDQVVKYGSANVVYDSTIEENKDNINSIIDNAKENGKKTITFTNCVISKLNESESNITYNENYTEERKEIANSICDSIGAFNISFDDNTKGLWDGNDFVIHYVPKIKYIRIAMNGNNVNAYAHLDEVAAYNAEGKNVLLRTNRTSYSAATDGKLDNYWNPGTGNQVATFELEKNENIQNIKIWRYYLDGRVYKNTKVEVSLDGENWTTLYDATATGKDATYTETVNGKNINVPNSHNQTIVIRKGTNSNYETLDKSIDDITEKFSKFDTIKNKIYNDATIDTTNYNNGTIKINQTYNTNYNYALNNLFALNDSLNSIIFDGYTINRGDVILECGQTEYIESTGTQYIDTGIIPSLNTKTNIRVMPKEVNGSGLFGSWSSEANSYRLINYSSKIYFDISYPAGRLIGSEFSPDYAYDITVNNLSIDSKGFSILFGTKVVNDNYSPVSLYLFGVNRGIDVAPALIKERLYGCKIYDNEIMVRDFLPVVDKDGKGCMYDKVSKKLFYNDGVGDFTCPTPAVNGAYITNADSSTYNGKKINDLFNNNSAIKEVKFTDKTITRDEFYNYTQVDYLQSTGTQYIDTGICPSNTTGIDVSFKCTDSSSISSIPIVFGSEINWQNNSFNYAMGDYGFVYANKIGSSDLALSSQLTNANNCNKIHNVKMIDKKYYFDNIFQYDYSAYTSSNKIPITLFALNRNNSILNLAKMNLYGCKIYNKNNVEKEFIPAIDGFGTPCLYEKREGRYYYSEKTSDFITGPKIKNGTVTYDCSSIDANSKDVNSLIERHTEVNSIKFTDKTITRDEWYNYTEVSYLGSTGTQYIDTGIVPTNCKIEAKFQYSKNANNTSLFGCTSTTYHLTWYNSKWYYACGSSESNLDATQCTDLQTLVFNNDNNALDFNGTEYGSTNGTSSANKNLNLFRRNAECYSSSNIYYFKMYDKSDNSLIRDFVPCKDPMGILCMYDKVSKQYFYNQGTGDFTCE